MTLVLVIRRPYRIGIGYSAIIGAALTLLLGITTLTDVEIVWGIVWNATFTLVAIIVLSLIFDEAGFFEYLSVRLLDLAGGSGKKLFVLIIFLGSFVSAFFANDGNVLVLTPIVYSLLRKINADEKVMIPFIMATGFVADSASLPLVVSNLVNIVTASYFSISFLAYSAKMLIPDIVAIGASLFMLWLFYRKFVGFDYKPGSVKREGIVRDPVIFKIAGPFLIALISLYAISGLFGIPVALIAVPSVAVIAVVAYLNRKIDVRAALKGAPWQIVLFSLGMYLVVFGMGEQGVTGALTYAISGLKGLPGPLGILSSGFMFAFIAAVMNNMPSVMMIDLSLSHISSSASLIYANVVANDIGPKFTTIGSLATLMWLNVLQRKGMVSISARYYTKVGLIIGLPVLLVTLLSVWAVFNF